MDTFPFLCLPENAQKEVFRTMDLLEIVSFSLLSKRTKTIAKAQNRQIIYIAFHVLHYISLDIGETIGDGLSLDFYYRGRQDDPDSDSEQENDNDDASDGDDSDGDNGDGDENDGDNGDGDENDGDHSDGDVSLDDEDEDEPSALTRPESATAIVKKDHLSVGDYYIFTKPEFELHDWINHFLEVLHCPILKVYFDENYTRFDVNSIFEVLRKTKPIDSLHMRRTDRTTREIAQRVLEIFPSTDSLNLSDMIYEDSLSIRKLLIKNYNQMHNDDIVTFDDILLTNGANIWLRWVPDCSEKFLNRFLKLWIRGSNPRMEHFCVQCPGPVLNAEDILKGIRCTEASRDREKVFHRSASHYEMWDLRVRGGYDITRFDGTVATLTVKERWLDYDECRIDLFVWP